MVCDKGHLSRALKEQDREPGEEQLVARKDWREEGKAWERGAGWSHWVCRSQELCALGALGEMGGLGWPCRTVLDSAVLSERFTAAAGD